jgi:hypothetical protein
MKAKADAMLKKGLISEKEHAKMSKGWTSEKIEPVKDSGADDLDPKSGNAVPKMKGKDSAKADDPYGKYLKRGSDKDDVGEKVSKDD